MGSIGTLMGLDIQVPDFSTHRRRLLFPVHLRDKVPKLGRFLARQPVEPFLQSLLADGADLVHGNFSIFPRAVCL